MGEVQWIVKHVTGVQIMGLHMVHAILHLENIFSGLLPHTCIGSLPPSAGADDWTAIVEPDLNFIAFNLGPGWVLGVGMRREEKRRAPTHSPWHSGKGKAGGSHLGRQHHGPCTL